MRKRASAVAIAAMVEIKKEALLGGARPNNHGFHR